MPTTFAYRRVVDFAPTNGDLSDPRLVARLRDEQLPLTAFPLPTTLVLDLTGKLLSPSALKELIVPLGQRVRAGIYGDARLVVAIPDGAAREITGLLARQYQIPLYLAASPEVADVLRAVPAGDLTEADFHTLEQTRALGSVTTVSALAGASGLQPSAANNRLVNVERKGYVLRVRRGRDEGDLFVDPLVSFGTQFRSSRPAAPEMREALARAGIHSDPYAHPAREVQGDAAEKVAEILRRRGKLPKSD